MMDKRRALLEEKRRLLTEQLDRVKADIQTGVAGGRELIEAQIAVAQVDVELARDQAGRVAALRRIVEQRRELERWAEGRHKMGEGEATVVLNAKLARLDAELALEAATRR